ncbi:MAG TPA: hypothetical protein VGV37_02340 [Aliidongia sp.]|uniref:hypothetical protein n=1 Tax=Aliidongia sp. TaxID=1914230 RepID=UPI002DDDAC83|nr:hypothetical protein [Aliidongia sp.]HEV2673350.1 hypothetical protein [Aliidongia sp.]
MTIVQDALQSVKAAIALAPDGFIPGGKPDPLINHKHGLIGAPISRIDGPLKIAAKRPFAAEFPLDGLVYAALHQMLRFPGQRTRALTSPSAA